MRRWVLMAGAVVALTGLAAGTRRASAQAASERTVTVVADGEARSEPDVAFLNAGVDAIGASPREAMSKVNTQIQVVTAALRRLGIASEDIQTSGLNLFTITGSADRPGDGMPVVTGYRASNSVSVTLRDLAQVDAVLDGMLEAGITNLNGLRFGIRDTQALRQRALADAVQQARPLAEAAARAAGLTVAEVMAIEETSAGVSGPQSDAMFAIRAGGSVETGALTMRVQIKVTFRLV